MNEESKIIRILGFAIGVFAVLLFPLAGWAGLTNILSSISGALMGLIFIIYGLGGRKLLAKILPNAASEKLW